MNQHAVHEYLMKKPVVMLTQPFGQDVDVYKVNHKMFATLAEGKEGQTNEDGEAKLPMTTIANLIMRIALTKKGNLFLKPLFFFQNTINTTGLGDGLSAFDFNGQVLLGIHFNDMQDITLYLGGGYRASGDAIARIGLDVKGLKFAFAYDINTGTQGLNSQVFQNNNRAMAFEVALSYVAKIYKVPVIEDVLFCPRF